MSEAEIHHLAFLFSTLLLETGAECHYGVATVWCHPDQSRIGIQAAYKMLESHDMNEGSLVVLAHAYDHIKYSPYPFPGATAVAIAGDAEWDFYATALSNITAWPLPSDKDGKVICHKELVVYNCFKCFSMSGEILWQVKPYGQFLPLTGDLQLGPASKSSAEEGVNDTNAPVIRDKAMGRERKNRLRSWQTIMMKQARKLPPHPATLS